MAALAQAVYEYRRLRVAVVADGARQPRWMVEALAKVASSGFAELAAVCVDTISAVSRPPLLWQAYCRADRSLFGHGAESEPRDVAQLVAPSRRLSRTELAAEGPFDVVFVLGDAEDAALAPLARFGAWRYCFGEDHGTSEAMAGIREVVRSTPVTATGIRIHRAGQPDRIACQSWSRTLPFSVVRSRENAFAKAAEFAVRALRDLQRRGAAWLDEETLPATERRDERFPGPAGLARDLSCLGTRVARRAAEKLFSVEQWSLAFRFGSLNHEGREGHGGYDESWNGSLDGWFRLEPPRDRFWADPFPVQRDGKSYIFFEELVFADEKAHISVVEVDRDGRASEPVRVLERDYHLSYPFLVEEGGALFMIPETAANHTVEIYRCVDFPRKWRRERVLLDGIFAADATVHRGTDRWWMFANVAAEGAEIHDELHLFSAADLLGRWQAHRANPVKSDVRNARPAGGLFRRGADLFRPAQICAPLYGSGIAMNRVTRLDAEGFAEEEVRRIVPAAGSGILGLHTLNCAGELAVTDAFIRRSRF